MQWDAVAPHLGPSFTPWALDKMAAPLSVKGDLSALQKTMPSRAAKVASSLAAVITSIFMLTSFGSTGLERARWEHNRASHS